MLRSLMTAVTGVRAHQTMLDVTGNNIANVNTPGFKRDVTIFQDLLYQTTQGATGPGESRGGVNASQVGLGVRVAAIETIHTQGFMQFTGNRTDMMISGDGFFVLRDGGSRIFSRAGNFTLDGEFNLVHSGTGFRVQGFEMQRDPLNPMNFIMAGDVSDIRIPLGSKMDPRATTVVALRCNLDSRAQPYLPIGFRDIHPELNALGFMDRAVVRIGGVNGDDFQMTARTNFTDPTQYITFAFDSVPPSGTPVEIQLEMTGIDQGRPVLAFTPPGPGPHFTLHNGVDVNVFYNDTTGVLTMVDHNSGATLFTNNVRNDMNYFSFSAPRTPAAGGAADTIRFLMEFHETSFGGSPIRATVWWDDPTVVAPGNMGFFTLDIPVNADGTFDLSNFNPPTLAGGALPAGFVATDLHLSPAAAGRGFEIRVRDPGGTIANANNAPIAGTLTMGGMHQVKMTIYDCQGYDHTLEVQFKKVAENVWRWEAFFPTNPSLVPSVSSGSLLFGPCGRIVYPAGGSVNFDVPFSLLGRQNANITLDFSGNTVGLEGEGVTQFASASTTRGFFQDGFAMGVLNNFTVGQDGTIVGQFTNGQNMPIFRVALAQFANPAGLEKIGDTMFRASVNSGLPNINAALEGGGGAIIGSTLEMSNVDLTEEFTRMIISQRGFQANTRVVTVSDSILEEVVNMKR